MAIMGNKREDASHREAPNPADVNTILGREARFSGKLVFEGAVRIDGKFDGEIHSDDLLLVGPSAEVRAEVHVGTVIINGYVEGNVVAKNSVEIKAPGRLRGNIVTPSLVVERGVLFDGTCKMSSEAKAESQRPQPAS